MIVTATRFHDFSAGHVVMGHEGKCAQLHGHNYRVHFTVSTSNPEKPTDNVGRVLDYSIIKRKLCDWLELYWDHKFLIHQKHPWVDRLVELDPVGVVRVTFNPTAENMALYLLEVVGPLQLKGTGVILQAVHVEETRKCGATVAHS